MPSPAFCWLCPACQSELHLIDKTWRCHNGHAFDSAKEGYVNLLLAQHKSSKDPGDNKAMVQARRAFLEQGFYDPLIQHLSDTIASSFDQTDKISLFDAGCGEGYYLQTLVQRLNGRVSVVSASGIDVSKHAIQKAAKRSKQMHFAVASSYAIPLPDSSQDVIVQVFAPSKDDEIARVLKPDGLWLLVSPGPDHLHELKQQVYQQPRPHKPPVVDRAGVVLADTQMLSFDIELPNPEHTESLLTMTPFYWQLSEHQKQLLYAEIRSTKVNFVIQGFNKI